MRRLPVLTIVLALAALPHPAAAQGQGRPKVPQASSARDTSSGTVSTSQFRQFGVWLDDATTRAEGGGSVGLGVGYFRGG